MNPLQDPAGAAPAPAAAGMAPGPPGVWVLSGRWTLAGLGALQRPRALPAFDIAPRALDGAALVDIDTAGAWVLQTWVGSGPAAPVLQAWPARAATLMQQVQADARRSTPDAAPPGLLPRIGRQALDIARQVQAFLRFVGQVAAAAWRLLHQRRQPRGWRLGAIWHEVQIGGVEALPIVGLMSFLLGVVVAYQGADQLRHYGANVFVVELVGYAMLREFAPLMGAIIIAGRSGSAYAAQLGAMVVAEEVDAMRTIGIDPLQRLVVPKILALVLALPLLTLFADITGVFGGMVMARTRLDIGYAEFAARFGRVMQGSALLLGLGKSVVFAAIIATVSCFQGLRTQGSADSVGTQTTLSVVQSIFLVIVADALFSVVFNALDL